MLKQIVLWALALAVVGFWLFAAITAVWAAIERYRASGLRETYRRAHWEIAAAWHKRGGPPRKPFGRRAVAPQGPALFMCCEHDADCERRGEPCAAHWQHPDNYRAIDPDRIYNRWNHPPRPPRARFRLGLSEARDRRIADLVNHYGLSQGEAEGFVDRLLALKAKNEARSNADAV